MKFKFSTLGLTGVLFTNHFCGMLCIALLASSSPKPILGASPNESELKEEFVTKTRALAQLAIDWGVFNEGGELSSMIQHLAPNFYRLHHIRLLQLKPANLQEPGQSPRYSLDLPYEDVVMTEELLKEIEGLYDAVVRRSRNSSMQLSSKQYAALLAVILEIKTLANEFNLPADRLLLRETRRLIGYADNIGIWSGGSAVHDLVSLKAPLFFNSHYSMIRANKSPSGPLTKAAVNELRQLVGTVRDIRELAKVFPVLAHRRDYPAFLSRIESVYREALVLESKTSSQSTSSCDGGLGDLAAASSPISAPR